MKSEKEIGLIVRQLRGEMSLRDFAKKCATSHTTIDNIEKGVDFRTGKPTQVKMSTLQKIASACGVSLAFIVGDNAENDMPLPYGIFPIARRRFPLVGEIACGEPLIANREHETYVEASADIHADFCLRAKGDSMIGARILDPCVNSYIHYHSQGSELFHYHKVSSCQPHTHLPLSLSFNPWPSVPYLHKFHILKLLCIWSYKIPFKIGLLYLV